MAHHISRSSSVYDVPLLLKYMDMSSCELRRESSVIASYTLVEPVHYSKFCARVPVL